MRCLPRCASGGSQAAAPRSGGFSHDTISLSKKKACARRSKNEQTSLGRAVAGFESKACLIRPIWCSSTRLRPILKSVSYTHLRAHETDSYLVCRLLLEKKKKK